MYILDQMKNAVAESQSGTFAASATLFTNFSN